MEGRVTLAEESDGSVEDRVTLAEDMEDRMTLAEESEGRMEGRVTLAKRVKAGWKIG